ncbi:hypothetical protein Tco_1199247 [Tanacetum coccineum]
MGIVINRRPIETGIKDFLSGVVRIMMSPGGSIMASREDINGFLVVNTSSNHLICIFASRLKLHGGTSCCVIMNNDIAFQEISPVEDFLRSSIAWSEAILPERWSRFVSMLFLASTFQRCMMAIFHDMIEEIMEVFMDDFSVFRDSLSSCLSHLDKMLNGAKTPSFKLGEVPFHGQRGHCPWP